MAVHVRGLRELRRDLRRLDKEADKELRREVREIAKTVAATAGGLAPRRTGTLAASYRGSNSGAKGVVRSRVFYSRFIEFGFHPRGGSTFVEGTHPIGRAIERHEEDIVDGVGDAIERAAERVGWR